MDPSIRLTYDQPSAAKAWEEGALALIPSALVPWSNVSRHLRQQASQAPPPAGQQQERLQAVLQEVGSWECCHYQPGQVGRPWGGAVAGSLECCHHQPGQGGAPRRSGWDSAWAWAEAG
jgi:hypothetical protein